MLGLDTRALRVIWTALVVAATLGLIYVLRHLLVLLAFSVFLAYLVFPLVSIVQRVFHVRHRAVAIGLVYLAVFGVLFGGSAALVPMLTDEATALAQRLPEMSKRVQSGEIIGELLRRYGWEAATIASIERAVRAHAQDLAGQAQAVVTAGLKWLASAWMVVLVPIFAFFILKDGERLAAAVEGVIDSRAGRGLWREIVSDVDQVLGNYVRALIVLCVVTFVVWSVLFYVAGVPYALLLAAIGGALEFVPVVGPVTSGVIVVAVSLFAGFTHPWLLVGFLVLWRGVQDYVTSPLIMGKGVELHPAVVIFCVLAGGEIGGVPGMFLAVPVFAAVKIIGQRLGLRKAESSRPTLVVAAPDTKAPRSTRPD